MRCQTPTESQWWRDPWAGLRAPGGGHGPEAPWDAEAPRASSGQVAGGRARGLPAIWISGRDRRAPASATCSLWITPPRLLHDDGRRRLTVGRVQANSAEWRGPSPRAAAATANALTPNDVVKPLSLGLPAAAPFGLYVDPRMVEKLQNGQKLWENSQMFNSKRSLVLEV